MKRIAPLVMIPISLMAVGCCSSDSGLAIENRELRDERTQAINLIESLSEQFQIRQGAAAQAFLALPPDVKERLHLHLLDFSKPTPYEADKMAQADIAAGHLNMLTGGLSVYTPDIVKALKQRYGIAVLTVAGCDDGRAIDQVNDGYNAVVQRQIEKQFGESYDQILTELGAFGSRGEERRKLPRAD